MPAQNGLNFARLAGPGRPDDGDTCGFTDGHVVGNCDQGIHFSVSGSNIHGHFSGWFSDF